MQSVIRLPLRAVSRSTSRLRLPATTRQTRARRTYADQPTSGDSTRSVPSNPAGGNSRLPFIIGGGVIFMMVAGRYILASDKSAASGAQEQLAERRKSGTTDERRDPRDSGVKTLQQKEQKLQQQETK